MFSLQTQRHLEAFLGRMGICQPEFSPSMHFSFPGHQLYIEWRHHQLWITTIVSVELDDLRFQMLNERVFYRLTTGYLFRPFRIKGGVALNVSLNDEATCEQLSSVYRLQLLMLAPCNKRN